MKPNIRLLCCAILILGSALYGVIIAYDEELARTVMLGYIGLVLTLFFLSEMWKTKE